MMAHETTENPIRTKMMNWAIGPEWRMRLRMSPWNPDEDIVWGAGLRGARLRVSRLVAATAGRRRARTVPQGRGWIKKPPSPSARDPRSMAGILLNRSGAPGVGDLPPSLLIQESPTPGAGSDQLSSAGPLRLAGYPRVPALRARVGGAKRITSGANR